MRLLDKLIPNVARGGLLPGPAPAQEAVTIAVEVHKVKQLGEGVLVTDITVCRRDIAEDSPRIPGKYGHES